jgi:hypothetical protein
MAGKHLMSAGARAAWLLVPAALLASDTGARAQDPAPPGCVWLKDNGRSYLSCEGRDEYRRVIEDRAAPRPESPAVVAPPPMTASPPPAPSSTAPASPPPTSAPSASAPKARPYAAPSGGAWRKAPGGGGFGGGKTTAGSQPSAAPAARPSAAAKAARRPLTVWALLEPADTLPRQVAGYGIVAFTTRPVPLDVQRYKAVCEAYKATLLSQAELPPDTPLSEQMITYWPIANKNTPEARRADCAHMVSNYALRLGIEAIRDADKQTEGLASRRGPFLIAWAPSESRFLPDALVLVMDLSQLDTQRSFVEVFQDWRQHITDNPELWQRGGFNVETVRRIIRDTFDRYGDGLLRLITTKS